MNFWTALVALTLLCFVLFALIHWVFRASALKRARNWAGIANYYTSWDFVYHPLEARCRAGRYGNNCYIWTSSF